MPGCLTLWTVPEEHELTVGLYLESSLAIFECLLPLLEGGRKFELDALHHECFWTAFA